MLFIHTIDKVLDGSKSQTRRIVKPSHHPLNYWRTEIGDDLRIGMSGDGTSIGVVQANGRDMWRVYSTYAAQPGRGKPAVARIMLKNIQREDVRNISADDARAEGFESPLDFLAKWTQMHDKQFQFGRDDANWADDGTWNYYTNRHWGKADNLVMWSYLRERPADRYDAWALTFELVQAHE